jgi:hypothetical protein
MFKMETTNLIKFFLFTNLIISTLCFDRYTPANANGSGNIIYLDRHSVYCKDGEALYGFRLIRPSSSQISYNYGCIKTESVSTDGEYTAYTPWFPAADDVFAQEISANRLSGIPVNCKNDYGLKGFKLESLCGKPICDIRYKYTCSPLKPTTCSSGETGWTDGDDGYNYYLDRQWIRLDNYNVLTGFQLKVSYYFRLFQRDGRYFKYSYNYCSLRNVEYEKEQYANDKVKTTNPARVKNQNELDFLSQKLTNNLD